jgi:hypothetical protein
MKRLFTSAVFATIVAALSPSLSAQWPLHPLSGVPKGLDGKLDLTAPAPRTTDGKPDLSGIWMSRGNAEPNGPPAERPPLMDGSTRGSPMTEAAKVTERFRRVNFGQPDIEFTLDDPKAYTRPFTVRIDQRIIADGSELIEFICHENQQFLKRVKVE